MLSGNVAKSGASQRNTQIHFTIFGPTTSIQGNDGKLPAVKPAIIGTFTTNNKIDLWFRAFEIVQQREAKLVDEYKNHLDTTYGDLSTANGDLFDLQYVKHIVSRLLDIGKPYKIHAQFPKTNAEMQKQHEWLAKTLSWSGSISRPAMSDQPHAALAWSGISIFLSLLANKKEYSETMLNGFKTISDMQIFWKSFEDTYIKSSYSEVHQDLEGALAELYSLIIKYQARAICYLSKEWGIRALEYVAGSQNWTGMIESIRTREESCLSYISEGQRAEIYRNSRIQLEEFQKSRILQEETLRTLKEHKRDKEERELLNDLAIVSGDYERYKNTNPKRVPGTCEWFLKDERFCKWRDSESGDLLWVSAGPGRGKSVLSKSLVDEGHLNSEATITITSSTITVSERVICYFFFKDGGEGKMDGAHALCAILHQLFKHTSTSQLISHALSSYRSNGQTLTQKMGELWRILMECANSSPVPIVCVLDALDECKEYARNDLIDALYELYDHSKTASTGLKLKFLVTSRPYDDLKISFDRWTTSSVYLHFDGDDKSGQIGQEINLVIDVRVKWITGHLSADDRDKISERLKRMENRTYLWLHLTLDIIQKNISAYSRRPDMEEFLSTIPSAVSVAYEKILSRSRDERKVEALLQIILAARRPLTLDEANYALALALEREQLVTSKELQEKLWPQDGFKTVVQNLCGLFISIYDSKLSFIHQTAREFLIHPERTGTWKGRLSMSKSHGILSGACINYLLSFNTRFKHHLEIESYPYFSYAAKNWTLHFYSQDTDSKIHRKLARELCRMSTPQTKNWVLGHGDISTVHCSTLKEPVGDSWTDLHLAAGLNLAAVVNDIIIHEHPNVNAKDHKQRSPLRLAIELGCLEVMEVLLGPESGVRVTGEDVCTLVGHHSRSAAMTALLLDKRGREFKVTEKVLKEVLRSRDGTTLTLLLDKRPNKIKWVVKEVAECGSIETMSLLLDKLGRKIKVTGEVVKAAIMNKSKGLQMITLLLDRCGPEIEITEEIVTAAAWNLKQGLQIITLLLDRRGHEFKITKEIAKAAVGNWTKGFQIITLLLDRRGYEFKITEEIVKAAAENESKGLQIITLLFDRRGHEIKVTDEIIKFAQEQIVIYDKEEMIALLQKNAL